MEAIVLAGGLGSRLQSVVSEVPKPMASIGDKPFLDYIFDYLKKNGVKKVILSVGYKWECIEQHFGDFFNGIQIEYSKENKALGTGGAIKKAMSKVDGDTVFILNGDTFFNVDLGVLLQKKRPENNILLSLKEMHNFDRYGCVETDKSNHVYSFAEKEYRASGNINGGIYLVEKTVFDHYDLEEQFSFEDFMRDNLQALNVNSVVFNGYFIDIGIPEDYQKAQNELDKHI